MNIKQTSLPWRINLCIMCLGVLLFIIGFSTNHLLYSEWIYMGLWKRCYKQTDSCNDQLDVNSEYYSKYHWKEAIKASRFILVIALVSQLVGIILNLFMLLLSQISLVSIMAGALSILAAVTAIIGSSVFVLRIKEIREDVHPDENILAPGYSFTLIMVSAVKCALSGAYQLWAAMQQRRLTAHPRMEQWTEDTHGQPKF